MAGLSLGVGGRVAASAMPTVTPVPAPAQQAPGQAAFGSGATGVVGGGGLNSVQGAAVAGLVAGGLIALTWWSLPGSEKNAYGRLIFTILLGVVFFGQVKQWGRTHLAEGQTSYIYQVASWL